MTNGSWQFWIDRGGTFTDVVARHPDGSLSTAKLLSENPGRYKDAAVAGIHQVLGLEAGAPLPEGLVEADLLGHSTHGLQLASAYLGELEAGTMTPRGEPETVADRGGAVTWDGRRLPGLWLTAKAVDLAIERAARHGIVAVAIRNSHGRSGPRPSNPCSPVHARTSESCSASSASCSEPSIR